MRAMTRLPSISERDVSQQALLLYMTYSDEALESHKSP